MARLRPGQFLNDSLIDFYLKHRFNELLTVLSITKSYHIFSSHFYTKLTEDESVSPPPGSDAAGKYAGISISFLFGLHTLTCWTAALRRHRRVQRWTKTTNVFGMDYILVGSFSSMPYRLVFLDRLNLVALSQVPVNKDLHWSLAVICSPGRLIGRSGGDGPKPKPKPFLDRKDYSQPALQCRVDEGVVLMSCDQEVDSSISTESVELTGKEGNGEIEEAGSVEGGGPPSQKTSPSRISRHPEEHEDGHPASSDSDPRNAEPGTQLRPCEPEPAIDLCSDDEKVQNIGSDTEVLKPVKVYRKGKQPNVLSGGKRASVVLAASKGTTRPPADGVFDTDDECSEASADAARKGKDRNQTVSNSGLAAMRRQEQGKGSESAAAIDASGGTATLGRPKRLRGRPRSEVDNLEDAKKASLNDARRSKVVECIDLAERAEIPLKDRRENVQDSDAVEDEELATVLALSQAENDKLSDNLPDDDVVEVGTTVMGDDAELAGDSCFPCIIFLDSLRFYICVCFLD